MALQGRLEIVEGAQKGEVVALGGAAVTLGRAPGNAFVVKDTTVSRQHAKVFERDGRHFVADLNSSHGTLLNGAKITLHELSSGDTIRIGATVLRYGRGAAPAAPANGPAPAAPANGPAPAAPANGPAPAAPANGPASAAPVAAPAASAAPVAAPPEADFELELEPPQATVPPPKPAAPAPSASAAPVAPAKPLPPVNSTYRRAVTETGEDPFADEPRPASSPMASAPAPSAAAPKPAAPELEMPQIELRGRTAEHFGARASGVAPAAPSRSPSAHTPPPLARIERRRRGLFTFMSDELDQRGPFARVLAALFALGVAGALLWATLHLFGDAPSSAGKADDGTRSAPERPSLPQKPK